jgi:hypothetical protein
MHRSIHSLQLLMDIHLDTDQTILHRLEPIKIRAI